MRPFNKMLRLAVFAAALAIIAGCSEYTEYTDRRDMISIRGGDAVQTGKVAQMVDPWPRVSADRHIAYNGAVMESAITRYRTGRVYRPVGMGTSSSYQQQQQPQGQPDGNAPLGPTVNGSATAK